MTIALSWSLLDIEPTPDTNLIKKAYRARLKEVHPEVDPEGFIALRTAYEEALEEARLLSDGTVEQGELTLTEASVTAHTAPPGDELSREIFLAFQQLLHTPGQRFSESHWHLWLDTLEHCSLQGLNDLRWPVLKQLEELPSSPRCMRLLLARFEWRLYLDELPERFHAEIRNFLDYLEQGQACFDYQLLQELSLPAQNETLRFWESLNDRLNRADVIAHPEHLAELLDSAGSVYFPASAALQNLLAEALMRLERPLPDSAWHSEDTALLLPLALLQGTAPWPDIPWSELSAASLTATEQRSLLMYCRQHLPTLLPLLTLAFSHFDTRHNPAGIAHREAPLSWDALLKFTDDSSFTVQGKAMLAYRDDRNSLRWLASCFKGEDSISRLYRQAWIVMEGGEALLYASLNDPLPEHPIEALIQRSLQAQAQAILSAFKQSALVLAFKDYLGERTSKPPTLSEDLTDEEHKERALARAWLARVRAYSEISVPRFPRLENEPHYWWIHFVRLYHQHHKVTRTPWPEAFQDWQSARSRLVIAGLLENEAEWAQIAQHTHFSETGDIFQETLQRWQSGELSPESLDSPLLIELTYARQLRQEDPFADMHLLYALPQLMQLCHEHEGRLQECLPAMIVFASTLYAYLSDDHPYKAIVQQWYLKAVVQTVGEPYAESLHQHLIRGTTYEFFTLLKSKSIDISPQLRKALQTLNAHHKLRDEFAIGSSRMKALLRILEDATQPMAVRCLANLWLYRYQVFLLNRQQSASKTGFMAKYFPARITRIPYSIGVLLCLVFVVMMGHLRDFGAGMTALLIMAMPYYYLTSRRVRDMSPGHTFAGFTAPAFTVFCILIFPLALIPLVYPTNPWPNPWGPSRYFSRKPVINLLASLRKRRSLPWYKRWF
ncbi:J domain-containing protein [Pokkaliibacter sp. CJK22405]|uniref:J domain-containing protein n=1 Tax=Pokkaliibacter sp. CJK22405 TaxID=3384615 RepID=UPI0039846724